jgi:hypothetical protein
MIWDVFASRGLGVMHLLGMELVTISSGSYTMAGLVLLRFNLILKMKI